MRKLKKEKVKKVVFADLLIKDKEFLEKIEKFADILIIDHHLYAEDLNSERIVLLNSQGYCGAYMCYDLFGGMQDIEVLDWLVAVACVADWTYMRNAEWMAKVYEKYGDRFVGTPEGVRESKVFGPLFLNLSKANLYFKSDVRKCYDKIGLKFGDIGDLDKYAEKVDGEIKRVIDDFEKKKVEIKDGYFYEFESKYEIRSWVASALTVGKLADKTVILASPRGKYYDFSARRQDGKANMNEYLIKLVEGFEDAKAGGHVRAAGGNVLLKDREEFKKRLIAKN